MKLIETVSNYISKLYNTQLKNTGKLSLAVCYNQDELCKEQNLEATVEYSIINYSDIRTILNTVVLTLNPNIKEKYRDLSREFTLDIAHRIDGTYLYKQFRSNNTKKITTIRLNVKEQKDLENKRKTKTFKNSTQFIQYKNHIRLIEFYKNNNLSKQEKSLANVFLKERVGNINGNNLEIAILESLNE